MPLLRNALRLMRGPARAAGLAELQHTLESGFDIFKAMKGAESSSPSSPRASGPSPRRCSRPASAARPATAAMQAALAALPPGTG